MRYFNRSTPETKLLWDARPGDDIRVSARQRLGRDPHGTGETLGLTGSGTAALSR